VRSKSGLRIISCSENNRSPFELCEPPWIRDNECVQCKSCQTKFDFIKRRHHCRRCGFIYCATCCKDSVALPRMCFVDPVRVCASCNELTLKENEFYEKHIKTLMNGASFTISSNDLSSEGDNQNTFLCKLSADHRLIVFEGESKENCQTPIEVASILGLKVIRSSNEYQDNSSVSGLLIQYEGCDAEPCELSLTMDLTLNRNQATAWIAALLKAAKMMFESKGHVSP